MTALKINSTWFEIFITSTQIEQRIKSLALELNHELEGKNPLFVVVLSGAYIFAADLLRKITIKHEVTFVKISSYTGTYSTGTVNQSVALTQNIQNRHVVLIEDIVDTGRSLAYLQQQFAPLNPLSISIVTLLFKPNSIIMPVKPNWVGFEIESKFVVGFGLDFDEAGRNLPDIYVETQNIK